MRLDRLRIHAAEKRIARAANFVRLDPVAAKKLEQQSAARSVHRIDHETKLRRAQAVPIDQRVERFEIRRAHVERLNQVLAGRQRRNAVAQHLLEFGFHLRDDRRAKPSCRSSP